MRNRSASFLQQRGVNSGAFGAVLHADRILAGYALSRFEIRHSKYYRAYMLFAHMVPIIILVVPFYLIAVWLNIYNTRMGHVLGLSTYAIPFATWVMIGYFEQLPKEVEHSAAIDGADRMKTLIYILVPMIKPGVVATALLTFILAWDDYIFALILLDSETLRTLPLAIGYLSSDYELTDGLMMAMGDHHHAADPAAFRLLPEVFRGGMTSGAVAMRTTLAKSTSTAIQLNSVSKSYGGSPILTIFPWRSRRGVRGDTRRSRGAARARCSKIIAGLEQPTSGAVRIGDAVMTDAAEGPAPGDGLSKLRAVSAPEGLGEHLVSA